MAQEKLFVMTQTDQEIHQLQTSRLILRNWRRKDIEPFAMLNSDPRVCEFLPTILSREETVTSVKKVTQYSFKPLGKPELKNIHQRFEVYAFSLIWILS